LAQAPAEICVSRPAVLSPSSTMKTTAAALLLILALGSAPLASAGRAQLNPLGRVIDLLGDLSAKITKEGEVEAKSYAAFFEFCDDASKNTNFEIKTATAKKEKLAAAIAKSTGDAEASSAKIEQLASSIAGDDGDLKSATLIREKEAADFSANEAELTDVIDTLSRAINVLGREMAKNPAAFPQVSASGMEGVLRSLTAVVDAASFSSADKTKLLALVQARQGTDAEAEADDEALGAPAATVYKTHSTSILDILEDLKEKAEEQLSDLRKAETSAKHNYEMLKQSLEDQISADNKDSAAEKAALSASQEAKAMAEADLARTDKDLTGAKDALELANSNCMQTAADHEATVAARTEELKVLAKATQLLQSSTAGAVGQSYSLLQLRQGQTSQLRTRADLANAEVVTLIKKLAQKHHSSALAQLASRIAAVLRYGASAHQDPFAKVKGLISELISRLEAEANSEAGEKAYCDEQIAKTEEKKGELEYDISKLMAKIDQAAAKSGSLKEEVQELQGELAALAQQQADMDKMRSQSNKDYVTAKAELEQGLTGVRKAIGVLREYYGNEEGAAMLQAGAHLGAIMRQPAIPELHSKATGAGSSIIGILEVVESDFAKNLASEETEEADAAAEYEKMTQENKVTKTLKEQDVTYKTQEFNSLDKNAAELAADKETTDSELSAILEYYAKIKERCIAKPETYESRKQRREAEIKGLKDALSILEDETAFVQRGKRAGVGHGHFLGA